MQAFSIGQTLIRSRWCLVQLRSNPLGPAQGGELGLLLGGHAQGHDYHALAWLDGLAALASVVGWALGGGIGRHGCNPTG